MRIGAIAFAGLASACASSPAPSPEPATPASAASASPLCTKPGADRNGKPVTLYAMASSNNGSQRLAGPQLTASCGAPVERDWFVGTGEPQDIADAAWVVSGLIHAIAKGETSYLGQDLNAPGIRRYAVPETDKLSSLSVDWNATGSCGRTPSPCMALTVFYGDVREKGVRISSITLTPDGAVAARDWRIANADFEGIIQATPR